MVRQETYITRKGPNRDQYVQFVPMAESEEEYAARIPDGIRRAIAI